MLIAAQDDPRQGERSGLRALRLGLARAAAEVLDLPLAVIGATQTRCPQDGLADRIKADWLLILLDGEEGRVGALALDAATVTALAQFQTIGRVSETEAPTRDFTATDAAMTAPLVDAGLALASSLVQAQSDLHLFEGFRFGARAEDARSLLLALEADLFRVFSLTLDLEAGTRQGIAMLILPDAPRRAKETEQDRAPAPVPGPRLDQAAGSARARMRAVIGRLQVPLNTLTNLQVGEVLTLDQARLDQTELLDVQGRQVAIGRLGQSAGARALRLNEVFVISEQVDTREDAFSEGIDLKRPDTTAPRNLPDKLTKAAPDLLPANVAAGDAEEVDELAGLSPEEAAVEISQLAGLSLEDMSDDLAG